MVGRKLHLKTGLAIFGRMQQEKGAFPKEGKNRTNKSRIIGLGRGAGGEDTLRGGNNNPRKKQGTGPVAKNCLGGEGGLGGATVNRQKDSVQRKPENEGFAERKKRRARGAATTLGNVKRRGKLRRSRGGVVGLGGEPGVLSEARREAGGIIGPIPDAIVHVEEGGRPSGRAGRRSPTHSQRGCRILDVRQEKQTGRLNKKRKECCGGRADGRTIISFRRIDSVDQVVDDASSQTPNKSLFRH